MQFFNLKRFIQSLKYAVTGLVTLFKREQNARFHLFVTIIVLLLSTYYRLSRKELIPIVTVIALVFIVEISNTAIEKMLDLLHPARHTEVAFIKDALAGAVLLAAIAAIIIGLLVFYPHLLNTFQHLY